MIFEAGVKIISAKKIAGKHKTQKQNKARDIFFLNLSSLLNITISPTDIYRYNNNMFKYSDYYR